MFFSKQLKNSAGHYWRIILKIRGVGRENQAILFEEINKELEAFLTKESNNKDATYGVLDLLTIISDSFQKKFDELIRIDSDKKEVCQ